MIEDSSVDRNTSAFNEALRSERTDPLAESCIDFDWNDLYRRLGETEDREDDELNQKLAQVLRHVFEWATDADWKSPVIEQTISRRFVALVWVTNPEIFAGSPSLRELTARLGVGAGTLANYTGEVSRKYGIQNRAQAHAWNRKKSDE
jgi:hypothetical protein